MSTAIANQMFLAFLGRPADAAWRTSTANLLNGNQPSTALQGAFYNAAISEGVFSTSDSTSTLVNKIFQQTFGFGASTFEQSAWSNLVANGTVTKEGLAWTIFTSYLGASNVPDAYKLPAQSKLIAIDAYTNQLGSDAAANLALSQGGGAATLARSYTSGVTNQATAASAVTTVATSVAQLTTSVTGTTYTLTTGLDNLTGTSNNDAFFAGEAVGGFATLTVGDSINGGAGSDTLNITQTAAVTIPFGVTVSGVERINVLSATTGTDINTSSFTGVEALSVTAPGTVTARAAATTAITVTDATQAGNAIAVNGGSTVTVTGSASVASAGTGGTVTVGATTAAAGAVTIIENVTSTNATNGSLATGGAISVTGGTAVSVTQNISGRSVATEDVLVSAVGGAVTITGTVDTTSVTVNQTAAVAAVKSQTVGVHGITDGAVTITDVTQAAGTADRIATVSLANYGTAAVTSSALSTLNLTGGSVISGALTLDIQSATTPVTTLALNLNGGSFGAIGGTHAAAQTTLNVAGATAASTLADFTSAGVTALNVSGDKAVTFTSNAGLSALTSVTSTNSAGVTLGSAIGTGVTFTGGAGADSIILGATTKAITLGGGNDTVTTGGLVGTGGSVSAGDGNDTIIMTTAESATAGASATFNSKFTGFEILRVSNAHTSTVDLDGVNQASTVILAAGGNGGTLNNLASGGTVRYLADSTGTTAINVRSAVASQTDVLNIDLSKTGGVLAAGVITAANVETINITAADASTAALGSAAAVNTLDLVATAATTINVSGNNGLNLTNASNTAVTTFNASGVVANGNGTAGATDAAASLAVTFLSARTTGSTTITGGAGDDVLTGVGAIDTISGGLGADIIQGGAGADVLDGGAGNADTVSYADVTAATSHSLTGIAGMAINNSAAAVTAGTIANAMGGTVVIGGNLGVAGSDLAAGTAGYLATSAAASTATMVRDSISGFERIVGSSLADYILAGEGANTITSRAGNDYINLTETTAAIDNVVFAGGATNAATLTANGLDRIIGFGATDTINVAALGSGSQAAVTATVSAAGTIAAFADAGTYILNVAGTAAALTTSGTAVVTDFTDMAQVAAFLSERYSHAAALADVEAVFIWNVGTTTYVYNVDTLNTNNTTIDAAEISLVGQITQGAALAAANVVFA